MYVHTGICGLYFLQKIGGGGGINAGFAAFIFCAFFLFSYFYCLEPNASRAISLAWIN
jgi:hypothetical protein